MVIGLEGLLLTWDLTSDLLKLFGLLEFEELLPEVYLEFLT